MNPSPAAIHPDIVKSNADTLARVKIILGRLPLEQVRIQKVVDEFILVTEGRIPIKSWDRFVDIQRYPAILNELRAEWHALLSINATCHMQGVKRLPIISQWRKYWLERELYFKLVNLEGMGTLLTCGQLTIAVNCLPDGLLRNTLQPVNQIHNPITKLLEQSYKIKSMQAWQQYVDSDPIVKVFAEGHTSYFNYYYVSALLYLKSKHGGNLCLNSRSVSLIKEGKLIGLAMAVAYPEELTPPRCALQLLD